MNAVKHRFKWQKNFSKPTWISYESYNQEVFKNQDKLKVWIRMAINTLQGSL